MNQAPSLRWCWLGLLPALFALAGALWLAPPLLWPDTAVGLQAWDNFTSGGTWNTLAEPSSQNLALDVESPVSWWSPGQYVPLGLLLSLGLPLGLGMLLLALLSAASLVWGLVRLAAALGAPSSSLPWIAVAAGGSWHTLYAFGMFIGGEVALLAVWPWIALATWRLRLHPVQFAVAVPVLFSIGSFAKHSFAISGFALLIFILVERWIETPRESRLHTMTRVLLPILAAGVSYLILRQILLVTEGPSPGALGQVNCSPLEAAAFNLLGPLSAATGANAVLGRLIQILDLNWAQITPGLLCIAPLQLGLYLWLLRRPSPLARLAGWSALTSSVILFCLMWLGASISFDDRHHRPAGVLLLATCAAAAGATASPVRLLARTVVIGIVAFGLLATAQRLHNLLNRTHPAGNFAALADMPEPVTQRLRSKAARIHQARGIVYLASPDLAAVLPPGRHIVTDVIDHDIAWIKARPYHGTAPILMLVLPERFAGDGRAAALRVAFPDYSPTSWTVEHFLDWDFWSATSSVSIQP